MAAKQADGMRIGPVSLLTLIAVLLLAVLAMLCVTTANAAGAMADRQADAIEQTYRIDSCGQALLAGIDEVVATERDGASAAETAAIAGKMSDEIVERALAQSDSEGVEASIDADGDTIALHVSQQGGKSLEAAVKVNGDSSYTIESWQITTTRELPQETLWAGSATSK